MLVCIRGYSCFVLLKKEQGPFIIIAVKISIWKEAFEPLELTSYTCPSCCIALKWAQCSQSSAAAGPTVFMWPTLTWAFKPILIQLPGGFGNTAQQINWTIYFGIPEGGTPRLFSVTLLVEQLSPINPIRRTAPDMEYHLSIALIKFAGFSAEKCVSSWSVAKDNELWNWEVCDDRYCSCKTS